MELIFGDHEEFPDNDEPAYKKIAKQYRDKIATGQLDDGTKLPSERELCELHDVSTITARNAMRLLQEWGLAVGVRGKGIFVRKLNQLTRIAPLRYFRGADVRTYVREAEASGVSLDVEHHTTQVQASEHIAERLGIDPGDSVTATRYKITMGGQPVTISVAYEPLALTGGTPIELPHEGPAGQLGIVGRFDTIGIHVNQVEEVLTIRNPTPDEARRLDMPTTRPVVEITQTFRRIGPEENDVTAVETADLVFPSDRYELRYVMEVK